MAVYPCGISTVRRWSAYINKLSVSEHDESKSAEIHSYGKPLQLLQPELAFAAHYWICMYLNTEMTEAEGNRRGKIDRLMEEYITGHKESKSWGVSDISLGCVLIYVRKQVECERVSE